MRYPYLEYLIVDSTWKIRIGWKQIRNLTTIQLKKIMATMAGVSVSSPGLLFNTTGSLQNAQPTSFALPLGPSRPVSIRLGRLLIIRPVRAVPEQISEKVQESIKNAQEACAGDPTSGECVAAWDEVEELSAAASHARDKQKEKESDPLENYCKDNPETIECKTFED
ncbi:hypothetical protein RJT34_19329 [Clitoria ternatea]|uniref:CP12 domain-containing protein n=1 Tax=Clitoria ternatea TaxID=43366 RepID=A0AAN9IQV3_CLITE